MNFARVDCLYLIWLLPLLFGLLWLGASRRRRSLSRFSTRHGLRSIAPGISERQRWIKAALLLTAVLMTILALAGPRYGYRWQEVERRGVDIILALDCSRSMLAADIQPNRLDRAKREIYDLLTRLRGDRIGLVAFAGTAFLQCPLTVDYDAFYLFLNALTPDFLPVGGTDLSGAILTAADAFDAKDHSEKAIILITDGEHTTAGNPLQAAAEASRTGIKIFTIGIGRTNGVPVPDPQGGFRKDRSGKIVLTRIDEDLLKHVAADAGGAYVRSVAGDMDLDVIYNQQIRAKLEAAELTGGRRKIWQDRFQWPLLAAALLLMVDMLIPSVRQTPAAIFFILCLVLNPQAHAGPWQDAMRAYREENFEQALAHFLKAQVDDPDNAEILYNLGNTYYRLEDYQAAREHYQRAQAAARNQLKQQSLYNAGNASYRSGMLQDAIRHYTEALKIDPEDRQARENLAFVKARLQEQPRRGERQNTDETQNEQSRTDGPGDSKQHSHADGGQTDAKRSANRPSVQTAARPATAESDGSEQSHAAQTQPSESDNNEQRQAPSGFQAETGNQNSDIRQAQRILNRLNDQPGRALIPYYEKQTVEKDW